MSSWKQAKGLPVTKLYSSSHWVASSVCDLKVNDIDSRDLETPPAIVEVEALPFNSEKKRKSDQYKIHSGQIKRPRVFDTRKSV